MHSNAQPARPKVRRRAPPSFFLCSLPALTVLGCHHPGTMDTVAAQKFVSVLRDGPREQSVRPGINAAYQNPDVEEWIERFESESREIFQYRRRIVESVGVERGMVVADIGSGTGLFTLLFSEAVGVSGKVVAVDIVPEFLELARRRARARGLGNVQTVLCEESSVLLPTGSVDLAFLCDTYHHFEYPHSTLRSIHRALRPGGELVVIDFKRIPDTSREWVLDHVRAGREVVIAEIVSAGFAVVDDPPLKSYLDENYLLRFRKGD